MSLNVYPQPAATNRFVLKQGTAGQIMLPTLGSPATPSTDSVNNSFGAWAQVTASTAVEYYITGVMAFATADSTVNVFAPLYVDIGAGGAGSEVSLSLVPIGSGIGRYGATSPRFLPGGHALLDAPVRVAAGTRLAARTALDGTANTTQNCKVYLLAVPYAAVEGN